MKFIHILLHLLIIKIEMMELTIGKVRQSYQQKIGMNLYEKNSTYTNNYTSILRSRKPLQYFPDDYNNSISVSVTVEDEKLKEEIQKWNIDYYELLEYRKNPTLGRMKCSNCLLSGSNDDPIFIGIEKVFARIISNQCNSNTQSHETITYHCNVMNIFSCPFQSKEESYNEKQIEESKYPYKREDLFVLQRISFAIEQAISTFFETTRNNEIIYEVDFENDRLHEIHTKYNGELQSWGWNDNVNEQLSKVKPISNIVIRDEQDVYNILTNREKLETLIEEYEKKNSHRLANEEKQLQICCDENTPCVSKEYDKVINSNKMMMNADTNNYNNNYIDSHKGENRHSKNIGQQSVKELENKHLKPELKAKIKEELERSHRDQLLLLKENKQNIIDFLSANKDSIRIEDLKIYEPIYKCYREKGNCQICNNLSNIICINCDNYYNKIWLCTNHWQQHTHL